MLSHGTLLYNSDLALLHHTLNADFKPVSSKSVASVRREVDNISDFLKQPMTQEPFLEKLLEGILTDFPMTDPYTISKAKWEKIYQLADEKYRSWEWTFGHTPPFSFMANYPDGGLNYPLRVWVKKGLIDRMESETQKIHQEVVTALSDQLIGERYDPNRLRQILNCQPTSFS
jgi:lipoate-protein ligase A